MTKDIEVVTVNMPKYGTIAYVFNKRGIRRVIKKIGLNNFIKMSQKELEINIKTICPIKKKLKTL